MGVQQQLRAGGAMLHIYVGSALLVLLRWAHARASERGTGNGKTPTYSFLYHRRSEGCRPGKASSDETLRCSDQGRIGRAGANSVMVRPQTAYRPIQRISSISEKLYRYGLAFPDIDNLGQRLFCTAVSLIERQDAEERAAVTAARLCRHVFIRKRAVPPAQPAFFGHIEYRV